MRPLGSSTARLKATPDVVHLAMGASEFPGMDIVTAAKLRQSCNNLHQIGIAMQIFLANHKHFPPAVVYGPDGKPWHSWRVLLLPYLDCQDIYDEYKFAEPWDGPNNSRLLEKMPAVYRDPIYGDAEGHFTHYAAATGPGTAFPGGPKFDGKNLDTTLASKSGMVSPKEIADGLSYTVLVGSASPDRKIPWMKPEDVGFDDTFPALGSPNGFAAPYKTDAGSGGVFVYGDGSVRAIRDDVDIQTWRCLFRIDDRGREVEGDVPGLRPSRGYRGYPMRVVYIDRGAEGVTARLQLEVAPPPERNDETEPAPPDTAPDDSPVD